MAEPLLESAIAAGEPVVPAPRDDGGTRSKGPNRSVDSPETADGLPSWLRDALARRNLRPHDGWPPVHHLLTERDLPSEPEEDERVSVSTLHDQLAYDLRPGLASRFRGHTDVLLAHDLYVYFDVHQDGRPRRTTARRLSPDVLVSFGVSNRHRGSYAVWEEGKPPDFALEILSEFTWRKDVTVKPELYERMGVREYFLFDPNDYVEPRLQAWRFRGREPERLLAVDVAGGMRGIYSAVLGLHLCHTAPWRVDPEGGIEAGRLRWHDPATGQFLPTAADMERRADAEATARRTLEARVAELEAQLRRQ